MHRTLLFAAILLSGPAQAYVILESKYRVEVSPGVFEDQLVLKCDNGSPLVAEAVRSLLERWGVVLLRSPAYCPAFNGSCERSLGWTVSVRRPASPRA